LVILVVSEREREDETNGWKYKEKGREGLDDVEKMNCLGGLAMDRS
jgi:hypothetical protein